MPLNRESLSMIANNVGQTQAQSGGGGGQPTSAN